MNEMNGIFSWHRFGEVLWHDMKMIWPRMGALLMGLVSVAIVEYLGVWIFSGGIVAVDATNRGWVIMVGFVLMMMCVPSELYKDINSLKGGHYFAMLPVSKLEKYMSMLLMTMVIVPLLFVVSIFTVDTIMWLFTLGKGESLTMWEMVWNVMSPASGLEIWSIVTLYLFWQSFAVFFATVFKKNKVIATLACFIGLHIVVTILVMVALTMGSYGDLGQFIYDRYAMGGGILFLEDMMIISCWVNVVLAVGLYVWAGFRMKNMKY